MTQLLIGADLVPAVHTVGVSIGIGCLGSARGKSYRQVDAVEGAGCGQLDGDREELGGSSQDARRGEISRIGIGFP